MYIDKNFIYVYKVYKCVEVFISKNTENRPLFLLVIKSIKKQTVLCLGKSN